MIVVCLLLIIIIILIGFFSFNVILPLNKNIKYKRYKYVPLYRKRMYPHVFTRRNTHPLRHSIRH